MHEKSFPSDYYPDASPDWGLDHVDKQDDRKERDPLAEAQKLIAEGVMRIIDETLRREAKRRDDEINALRKEIEALKGLVQGGKETNQETGGLSKKEEEGNYLRAVSFHEGIGRDKVIPKLRTMARAEFDKTVKHSEKLYDGSTPIRTVINSEESGPKNNFELKGILDVDQVKYKGALIRIAELDRQPGSLDNIDFIDVEGTLYAVPHIVIVDHSS